MLSEPSCYLTKAKSHRWMQCYFSSFQPCITKLCHKWNFYSPAMKNSYCQRLKSSGSKKKWSRILTIQKLNFPSPPKLQDPHGEHTHVTLYSHHDCCRLQPPLNTLHLYHIVCFPVFVGVCKGTRMRCLLSVEKW